MSTKAAASAKSDQAQSVSHEKRRERRAKMAKFVAEHPTWSMRRVAAKLSMNPSMIRIACEEHGVPVPTQPRSQGTTVYAVISGLLAGKPQVQVANELKVHKQYVFDVKKRAMEAGIKFPPAKASG